MHGSSPCEPMTSLTFVSAPRLMFNFTSSVPSISSVVVFIHNIPVRFVNQLKLKGLSRSHPVHMATAAVVTAQQEKGKKRERKGSGGK